MNRNYWKGREMLIMLFVSVFLAAAGCTNAEELQEKPDEEVKTGDPVSQNSNTNSPAVPSSADSRETDVLKELVFLLESYEWTSNMYILPLVEELKDPPDENMHEYLYEHLGKITNDHEELIEAAEAIETHGTDEQAAALQGFKNHFEDAVNAKQEVLTLFYEGLEDGGGSLGAEAMQKRVPDIQTNLDASDVSIGLAYAGLRSYLIETGTNPDEFWHQVHGLEWPRLDGEETLR